MLHAVLEGSANGYRGWPHSFDATQSSDDLGIDTYMWDFGDGYTLEGTPNLLHIYRNEGTYTASVTVVDHAGQSDADFLGIEIGENTLEFSPVDILFIIDTTGSMVNDIMEAKNRIVEFNSPMTNVGVDAHYGLVGFGSQMGSGSVDLLQDIVDFETFNAPTGVFQNLFVGGGNEVGTRATHIGLTSATFRTSSTINVILITDDHDRSGPNSLIDADQSLTNHNALFNFIGRPSFGNTDNTYGMLTTNHAGKAFDILEFRNSPDEFFAKFIAYKLQEILNLIPPVAVIHASPNLSTPGYLITFDGSASHHVVPNVEIIDFRWDFDASDGVNFTAPEDVGEIVTHAYPAFGMYTATLQVADNRNPSVYDTATVQIEITLPSHPPTAAAGGSYVVVVGEQFELDGSGSFDIDQVLGDSIQACDWEIDGQIPYDFSDSIHGEQVTRNRRLLYTWR